jgi:hypothetical protein
MDECMASLLRRSSTQVSAHASTLWMMLMSSRRMPSSLIWLLGVVSKICALPGPQTISHNCNHVSGATQTCVWLIRELAGCAGYSAFQKHVERGLYPPRRDLFKST